jgi:Putative transposase/Transposase zinc-binding domain
MAAHIMPQTAKAAVRPQLEVADIFRLHGEQYRSKHHLSPEQHKAMRDIQRCRTSALGGHVDVCDQGCGYTAISYNSCRNRNCPKCQGLQSAKWLQDRLHHVLPVDHFHLVVTQPHELNPLILNNQRTMYNMLFQATAQSLLELTREGKRRQMQPGFTAVLHTWNQDLGFHPHLHLVVTAGGLDESQTKWIPASNGFLVCTNALAIKIRGKFLDMLKRAYAEGQLALQGNVSHLSDPNAFSHLIGTLYAKQWVLHTEKPFAGAQQVFQYLSRYTHRVAISNGRLQELTETDVSFSARDNNNPGKHRSVTLPVDEFIRRFLLHVLPSGFTKIRHYGLMAPANAKTKLPIARSLLQQSLPCEQLKPEPTPLNATWQDILRAVTGVDLTVCPRCAKGRLIRQPLDFLAPSSRDSYPIPIFPDTS